MKFTHGNRRKAIEYEKDLVKHWKENRTFVRSVEMRPKSNSYVFYDGPPFITGVPHHGTLLTSVIKDAVPRYWTMKGKRVERQWGWDCHGLPAEVFTEKKLGIQDRRDIGTKISLEEYITTCRDNMVQTGNLWEDTIDRIGRWVNFQGAYKTMDKDFMESVWWAFKTLHEKGKIYEGERVLLYCTRDATPLSKAEISMDNSYKEDTDPSVYVKFKLTAESLASLLGKHAELKTVSELSMLAWTTTPWTLPSNSAVAINNDLKYAVIKVDGEFFVVAENLTTAVLKDEKNQPIEFESVCTFTGKDLVGLVYEPLFPPEKKLAEDDKAFKIWHAPFVHDEDGTGIAHESPAYGEDDYELSKKNNIPWIMSTDENGFFTMGEWKGENIWEVNKQIAKTLKERGVVWKIDYIKHSYPHCYRCDTKLMYRAHPSWFMDIDGQRTEMLEQNSQVNWFPKHIKHGRSEKTIQSAPDWNLSRDRFWATPMPVWKGKTAEGEEISKVVGSYAELKELSGVELDDYHRPWIDDVKFTIDGVEYTRIEKVMDCWFESGSMPFAQYHYPFENKEHFENNFPADFIVEYIPQVRAWFYYMNAVNVGLFGKVPFKHAIAHGTLAGNDGRKMSKLFGNYTDPNELMDMYSADALRFLFIGSTLMNGEDYALLDENVADVNRKLAMVWNMYDFFTMYAEVDGWESPDECTDPTEGLTNQLDQWIVSRMHQLIQEVDEHMQKYDLPNAVKPILPFIDDASNWYVRRSRKRFWKSDDDTDKQNAYRTLHYILVQLSHVLAPFTPFLADELYGKLTDKDSVHLADWPEVGHVNQMLIDEMAHARAAVTEGLALRARAQIKLRQPLASATIPVAVKLSAETLEIVKEELNVKQIIESAKAEQVSIDTDITDELHKEGIAREVVRFVQEARKKAGLQVDDRIELNLNSDDETITLSIKQHEAYIMAETLTKTMVSGELSYSITQKVGKASVVISLQKAA